MIRIIRDVTLSDPAFGIALEEVLLETARKDGVNTIRLWRNGRAVVIGRSQEIESEVDLDEVNKCGIPVIRRISGGGAVYHYPGNLNISVYLRDGRQVGGVMEAFHRLGGAIAAGLRALGINIQVGTDRYMLHGKKVGGAAQARRGTALLYHSTLLVYPDVIPMDRFLRAARPGYRTSGVPSRPYPTASISTIIERKVRLEEIVDALTTGLVGLFGETAVAGKVNTRELMMARELVQEKYGTVRWNRQR